MTKSQFEALNSFVDQTDVNIYRINEERNIMIGWQSPGLDSLPYELHAIVMAVFNDFQTEVIAPLLYDITKKFRSDHLDDRLIFMIRGELELIERERIEKGKLSFKNEIKKRLGLLPDFNNLRLEIDCIFETALK